MKQERTGIIYYHFNIKNGKRYVGKTIKSPDKRWREHQNEAKNGSDYAFHRAIRKYGAENFISRVVEDNVPESQLKDRESHYIDLWNTMGSYGYNMTKGGDGGTHSEESKKRRSEAVMGEKNPFFGRKHSEETKELLRILNTGEGNGFFGRKHTDESKKKISDSKKGKPLSKEHREKLKLRRSTEESNRKRSNTLKKTNSEKRQKELNEMGQSSFL